MTISDDVPLTDLLKAVEEATGVPASGQKLILNGRALTSMDHEKSLRECGVANFAKIMVLGKKFDPEGDEIMRQIKEVEKKSLEVDARLAECAKEVKDIEDGYLASDHHEKALKALLKRCRGGTEEYMRLLEKMDAMQFEEHQSAARARRKSVVDKVNKCMDKNELLQEKIEGLIETAGSK